MQYLDGLLCLEYSELVPEILTKEVYDASKFRGNIKVHGLGGNGRKVLVEYESMPSKYKAKVREIYGDPYLYASRMPIINAVVWDNAAHRYYTDYTLPTGDKLPNTDTDLRGKAQINYVHRYTEAASWLNMLLRMTGDKAALKRELNISVMQFWDEATDIIRRKGVNIPVNAKRLKEKLKVYAQDGYESLIEVHKFGNDYSKKVKDDVAESLLKGMLSLRNKHDDTVIASAYNDWAIETGRETISPGTVGYWRKKWANYLLLEREGMGTLYTKVSKQGQRKRPSAPLLRVNSDDNVFDAFFFMPAYEVTLSDGSKKKYKENQWFRPVLYVVMDAFNDYPLGYAVGPSVTKELIKEAYRNAQRHVQGLTGDAYLWQEIQTDRWGVSGKNTTDLEGFYSSMATFVPAALKNKQTKYIERAFGVVWHQELKKLFPKNYSGHNVTAKEKLNTEILNPKDFPTIEEGWSMIEEFINRLRLSKRQGSDKNRLEEWVEAFQASDKSKKQLLTPADRLQIFGKVHEHLNQITAKGITPTLLGEKRIYELSQQQIFEHIGKRVQVIYDEQDLSEVLITDGKSLRFTAKEYKLLPSAIADYEEGDRERINGLLLEKKTILPAIQKFGEDWKSDLERAGIDAESRLLGGVMQKSITHSDQKALLENSYKKPKKQQDQQEDNIDYYGMY
ncbi:MAG: hypothetical protein ACXIUD_09655 [Mongoliitalea sp.]